MSETKARTWSWTFLWSLLAELLSTDQLTVSIEHKTGSIGRRWCWLHRALPTRVWLYRESMHAWPNPNGLEGWVGATLHRGHRFVRGNFFIFKPDTGTTIFRCVWLMNVTVSSTTNALFHFFKLKNNWQNLSYRVCVCARVRVRERKI